MLDGELVQGARPLLPLLASAGARIEGLRLGSGGLVLKVQRGDKAAQVSIGARESPRRLACAGRHERTSGPRVGTCSRGRTQR